MLLVPGTGGGYSVGFQTASIMVDFNVTLVIEETFTLAADQKSKIKSARNAYMHVLAYQLDYIKQSNLIVIDNKQMMMVL